MRSGLRLIALIGAAFLFALQAFASDRDAALSRFEKGWPALLHKLELDPARNYAVLLQVPPVAPLDTRNAETLRQSIGGRIFSKQRIGHVMMAWQCGGRRGLISQSGESSGQGSMMMLSGWGMTPVLSTFTDGHLRGRESLRPLYSKVLLEGRGQVVAAEVSAEDCAAMRGFTATYATHKAKPWSKFSLLLEPGRFEGGGCVSFALELARKARLFPSAHKAMIRTVPVHEMALGRKQKAPPGVLPFVKADTARHVKSVSFFNLMKGPLDQGGILTRIRFADPELLFALLTGARSGTGPSADKALARMRTMDDPLIAAAHGAGRQWARHYSTRRVVDPMGLRALVLER